MIFSKLFSSDFMGIVRQFHLHANDLTFVLSNNFIDKKFLKIYQRKPTAGESSPHLPRQKQNKNQTK